MTQDREIMCTVADVAAPENRDILSTQVRAYSSIGVFSSTTLNFVSELGRQICVTQEM